jgi:hypothetical protein
LLLIEEERFDIIMSISSLEKIREGELFIGHRDA